MTITQTVEIPASRRIILEVPKEVPAGRTQVIIQFPVRENAQTSGAVPPEAKGQMSHPAFCEALRSAQGAWKANPWENHLEDVRAMREEWEHRN